MMGKWIRAAGACVALVACSSSSGSPGASSSTAPAPSQRLADLSPPQQGGLCDSLAALYGGYGHSVECHEHGSTSTATTWSDQATCVAQFSELSPSCQATVAQATTCNEWQSSPCDHFGQHEPPECSVLGACTSAQGGGGSSTSSPGTPADGGGD